MTPIVALLAFITKRRVNVLDVLGAMWIFSICGAIAETHSLFYTNAVLVSLAIVWGFISAWVEYGVRRLQVFLMFYRSKKP
jgi:hypothetical protein